MADRSRPAGTDAETLTRLHIYVSGHCFTCPAARSLAAAVAARFGAGMVQVIDVDVTPDARPPQVIAVPTYVLDGRIVALGNPRPADLFSDVERALAADPARPA